MYKFNKDSREYVQFETAPVVLGTEHLSPALSAIRNKQKISFEYTNRDLYSLILFDQGNDR